MGGTRILNDDQIDEMAELRERGLSFKKIADHFAAAGTPISPGSIGWQCLRVGADLPPEKRRRSGTRTWGRARAFSADEDSRLLALEAEGASYIRMARALGRPENSIRGRLMTLARHAARREEALA